MSFLNFFKKEENIKGNKTTISKDILLKEREQKVSISLAKKTDEQIVAQVSLILDVSGSMENMFYDGIVQNIIERIYPIASKFDDDKELDVWIFSNNQLKLQTATLNNYTNYVKNIILNNKSNNSILWGGTNYAPVMKDVFRYYKKSKVPAYNIFITDGDNFDKHESEKIIKDASNYGLFWQFVGIGLSNFSFLEKLDNLTERKIDNANFFQLNDIERISDDNLYDRLLNEFPEWLKEARKYNII
jgi:ankyrin repeat protein